MNRNVQLNSGQALRFCSGQAAMITVIFFLFISLIVLGTFASLGVSQLQNANELFRAKRAYVSAESGLDDVNWRITNALSTVGQSPFTLTNFNGGDTTVTVTANPDSLSGTEDYLVNASSNIANRYRNVKMIFKIPDDNLFIGAASAAQAGWLGLELNNNAAVKSSAGEGTGNVFSNGTIKGLSGIPQIDGNATVAKGTGSAVWHQYCTQGSASPPCTIADNGSGSIADCPPGMPCEFDLGRSAADGKNDGAQSFISSNTTNIVKIKVFLKRVSSPRDNIQTQIFKNRTVMIDPVTGAVTDAPACVVGVTLNCHDFPQNGTDISTGPLLTNTGTTNGTFDWVEASLVTSQPLVANKKYWIVFNPTVISGGYYQLGALDNGYTAQYEYLNENAYYDLARDGGEEPQYYRYTDSGIINPVVDIQSLSGGSKKKDIAFQVFVGEAPSEVNGVGAGGKLNIVGNALAEKLRGLDIDGIAYYEQIQNSYIANDEVIAGANYPTPQPLSSPFINKTYDCDTAGAHTANCMETNNPAYLCRKPTSVSSPKKYPTTVYCGCATQDIFPYGTYCQNATGLNAVPTWKYIFGQGPPLHINLLNEKRDKATTLGCQYYNGSAWVYDAPCTHINDPPTNTLTYSDANGSAANIINYGVVVGNLTIANYTKFEIGGLDQDSPTKHCDYHATDTGPGSENTSDTDPCYDLWVKGDLTVQSNSQVTGNVPAGTACNSDARMASIFIIVEGKVKVQDQANIYGLGHASQPPPLCTPSGKSGFFIVSNDPTITGVNTAITISNNANSSVFWAYRGTITINNSVGVKALAAPKIILNDTAQIVFDEGLADPFSDSGGNQPQGSDIHEYHETE